ncbi:unnamed protein product [Penicillium salamii]|uniref:Uncharacterized protein n=1 Tax=Penicillium salamii TaxID=1612424 RepID=A0A9W4NBX8_9EURO|nr:unnamed protein product [Penicillium salamii]CAG8012316.1 unnamed protein product [Penicillium salamii]CAG8019562.1 unnamed protein product [Penicillium salamii]CAG8061987.1 unnamed protein product [Penicillium salamii]CAG8330992.1 unnamed protein product [Penicillium salamii]
MVGSVQRAKRIVETRIPALQVGNNHTRSSALHPISYIGPLYRWDSFEQNVNAEFQEHNWQQHNSTITILPLGPPGPHNIANEQLAIGDENGLQGRFNQNVGHVMSAVFGSQGLDLEFGDFKASNSSYSRTPDVAIMNGGRDVQAVGELKAQWIDVHDPSAATRNALTDIDSEEDFRHQIGQLARYMRDLRVQYGFYSTYKSHVFLSQELVDGQWAILYSPVISDTIDPERRSALTVRQCYFFLGKAASRAGPSANLTPTNQWTRNRKA